MALNLSLRQLTVFREVMRCGAVSSAAMVLHRTQPALSSTLASMERELGFELFVRKGNRLIPKPEAHFFREEVERVLENFTQAVRTMGEVSRLEAGQLRIACMPAASLFLVPQLIADFAHRRPEVRVSLQSNSSSVVHDWVASQQFDVGIAEVPQERDSLIVETIETECVCAVPSGDPLARKKELTPRDLSGKPMASLFAEHFTCRETVKAFEAAGARFRQRFELRAFVPGFAFVEQGLAYCVCDPISAASYGIYRGGRGSIVFRPFRPAIAYPFAILSPSYKPRSLLADEFCGSLKEKVLALIGPSSGRR